MNKKKKITISDVAEKAGVSKSTVSQYINQRYRYMSADTKEKIQEVIKELDFRPNDNARNLKVKKTKVIGILVANILHTLSTEIIRIVEERLQQNGIKVFICNSADDPEKEKEYIDLLISTRVDGMIIFPVGNDFKVYNYLVDHSIPMVFVDRLVDGIASDSVLLDNHAASFLAVSMLAEKGHNDITFITLPIDIPITPRVERIEGFQKAMAAYHLEINNQSIYSLPSDQIKDTLSQRFTENTLPTAIVAGNDLVLREVLSYLKQQNISIPEDVAVVSIDNVDYSEFYQPSITTIGQPIPQMGIKAAELLLERIENQAQTPFITYRFAPELNERNSC
ncbi:LacI family DNA-binding transcriptional regulator [Peribacillus psychrosaccharolyticus]|uniref:LacI family DNA-binding transcriptional regulator n=1 Tax=Peribacillus psychrosaccharolyticus TaxID=1407 RepID=A0A974NQC9_PERPY|nr:LacI family DNA-binding transcriptional regulator [Peribacillus psychrosaccharolyticus]MEC2057818.1 LacI family DNA-binding transcriptional regulator [Peribacillus psychrosaccharolyticus]MED3746344.1 LacI family DNA-binding transcriptional regulator [Peribacillus psychrosaccharolyticus]QQT01860.1 LacI family DNA-binding transcriptional regulator [Peribacillus psychrosaccharolyticus]